MSQVHTALDASLIADDDTFNETLGTQERRIATLKRVTENFRALPSQHKTLNAVKVALEQLETCYVETKILDRRLYKLAMLKEDKESEYFTQSKFEQVEAQYMTDRIRLYEAKERLTPVPIVAQPNEHGAENAFFKLEKIKPPKFNGKISKWKNFKGLYNKLVHDNQAVPTIQKFFILRASLEGEALELIDDIDVTEENYNTAWKILNDRYEDASRLIWTHLKELFSVKKMKSETAEEARRLHDQTVRAREVLSNLKRKVEHWDDIFVYLTVNKMDNETRKHWELNINNVNEFPSFQEVKAFLDERAKRLDRLPVNAAPTRHQSKAAFKAMHTVTEEKVGGHTAKDCEEQERCKNCQKKHHSLVCKPSSKTRREKRAANTVHAENGDGEDEGCSSGGQSDSSISSDEEEEAVKVSACHSKQAVSTVNSVLLATARVRLRTVDGRTVIARALLDQGSELSFISESAAQALRAPQLKVNITIAGVNGNKTATCKTAVSCAIEPCNSRKPSLPIIAHVLPTLTSYAPRRELTKVKWSHLEGLIFADADPMDDRKIDVIIGADLYPAILLEGIRKGSVDTPMAQETIFGWVVSGPLNSSRSPEQQASVHHCIIREPVDELIRRFWELEELSSPIGLNSEDQKVEDHFKKTHSREANGRYVVRLPLKTQLPLDIGESYGIAKKCLERQRQRFHSNPLYQCEYDKFLMEYQDLGHMKLSPKHLDPGQKPVYLPHHAVIREDSSTSPIRVVFNASSRTTNGSTLNDHLYVGPQLLPALLDVILKWRKYPVALRADIEKMFRQILVSVEEQHLQRILWQPPGTTEVRSYDLQTVTYGTAPAPFLANRVLKQLAKDEQQNYPRAAAILERDFYVDDVLTGALSIEEAKEIQNELQQLLLSGGMNLRKWASSHPESLRAVPCELLAHDHTSEFDPRETVKVLGVQWNMVHDCFRFSVFPDNSSKATKRGILSTVARIFDPVGWLTPTTIIAKILIQELWLLGMDWDEEVPDTILEKWKTFQSQLTTLQEINISRYLKWTPDLSRLELHGFCDASTQAYAAAVYLRITGDETTQTEVNLIMGKAKVAPTRHQTVAKLELCAAHLLARIVERVRDTMELTMVPIHAWSDSQIVLAWLRKHAAHWPTFVANRVSDIQTRLPTAHWHHVPTTSNPADCASRGVLPVDLITHELWWTGPKWLKFDASQWPQQRIIDHSTLQTKLEDMDNLTGCVTTRKTQERGNQEQANFLELPQRISSWPKILRITAYCYKLLNALKGRQPRLSFSALMDKAHEFWIRQSQQGAFESQIRLLQAKQQLPTKDKLNPLHPVMDNHGVMRMNGRIARAAVLYEEKQPIIVPADRIAELIIDDIHRKTLHGGLQLTLSTLRQKYWILNARRLVKSHIHRCVKCIRYDGKPAHQIMSALPPERVTPSPPFTHTGLDYAGPVNVRTSPGRGHKSHKGYIALFVCMVTRAIHLELVSDYSTPTFLAAFDRFVSRRGLPSDLYSDNGTTFQGAARELREVIDQLYHNADIQANIATKRIEWHFIPPSSPHFGGLWEAGVKSVKNLMKRLLDNCTPTYEEWITLLSKIECNLNSRPLGLLRDDPESIAVLTPGHFLIGRPLNVIPASSTLDLNPNRLSRWQFVHHLNENFWNRWRSEYLHTLQTRQKWRVEQANLKINDVVLIKDLATPPSKWPLARVIETHPGEDGKVRAVKVKTGNATYTRPIVKLIPLHVGHVMAGGEPPLGSKPSYF